MADEKPTDAEVKWSAIERMVKLVGGGLAALIISLAQMWIAYQQSKQSESLLKVVAESQKQTRVMMGHPPEGNP